MITDSDFDREFQKECHEIAKQNGKDFNSLRGYDKDNIEMLAYEAVEMNHFDAEWLDYFERRRKANSKKRG